MARVALPVRPKTDVSISISIISVDGDFLPLTSPEGVTDGSAVFRAPMPRGVAPSPSPPPPPMMISFRSEYGMITIPLPTRVLSWVSRAHAAVALPNATPLRSDGKAAVGDRTGTVTAAAAALPVKNTTAATAVVVTRVPSASFAWRQKT